MEIHCNNYCNFENFLYSQIINTPDFCKKKKNSGAGNASEERYFGTLPKIRITAKKALNKSCSALNFVQKSPPPQGICLSPLRVELGDSKDL